MKVIIKRIVKCIMFLTILALMAGSLFGAFTPDDGNFVLPADFYRKEHDRFDVLFVGDSLTKQGIFPMTLYEKYGISSYNLGTGDQTVALSYYLLKDAIKRQHPKLVVLEVGMGDYRTTYEGPEDVHYITDHMPFFSRGKYELIRGVEKEGDDSLRFLFPWYEYHSRWTELTEKDVVHEDSGAAYGSWILAQSKNTGYFDPCQPDPSWERPEVVDEYLEKVVSLCEETGTQLQIISMPVFGPGLLPAERYPRRVNESASVEAFAEEHNIPCMNLTTGAAELGLSAESDTLDGMHLNMSGAEKFSAWLGQVLKETYDLPDRREDPDYAFLARDHEKYMSFRSRQMLATDNRAATYFGHIKETFDTEDYLYVLTAAGDTSVSMSDTVRQSLREMGLSEVDAAAGNHPYIAVIDKGNVVYETADFTGTSDSFEDKVSGITVFALSRNAEEGSSTQVMLDLNNYVLQGPGLNVVVYDKETGRKVDASYVTADAGSGEIMHRLP